MREPQKVKRFGFPLAARQSPFYRVIPKLNQLTLLLVDFQTEFPQPFFQLGDQEDGLILILQAKYYIIGISDNDALPSRSLSPPLLHPQV